MTHRRIIALATALLGLVAVASACATGRGAAPGADPGWPQGRTFLSVSVTDNGAPRDLIAGTRIRLVFGESGRFSAQGGCNSMSGQGRLEGSALVLSDLAQTEMACPDGRMEQDAWLAEFLTARPTLRLTGDELTMTRDTTVITLLDREVADPDRPLADTRWVVDTLIIGDAASSVPPLEPAALLLDPAGTFLMSTGCAGGELRGTWTDEPSVSRLSLTVTDDQPCHAGGSNALDAAVRSVLSGPVTYQITANRLRLMGSRDTGLGLLAES